MRAVAEKIKDVRRRLTTGVEIIVGGVIVPVWVSFLGAFFAALLAVWMVVAARRS